MNNSKGCMPYVCTGSGCKWVCERHDIMFAKDVCDDQMITKWMYIFYFYEQNLSHFDVQMHSQTNAPHTNP